MRTRPNSYSVKGVVSSSSQLASLAGADIIRSGGNLADAAVATSAVLCVTQNNLCGLGGDMFALIRMGDREIIDLNASGRAFMRASINYFTDSGLKTLPSRGHNSAITVPGIVKISDLSADIACIAVQGPLSVKIAEDLSFHMPDPFTFSFSPTHSMNGLTNSNDMIISGTGYTGERGFEIILPSQDSPDLWDKIYKIADKIGGGLCGLGARDTLRMEKGMLLSGTDFNHDRDPFECSIGFIVNNGNDFVGKNNLIARKGVDKEIFRGFILKEKSIPRSGFEIYYEGKKIGRITSGTMSPILNKSIGLGFINKENAKPGSEVEIVIRDKKVQAEVSRPKIVP